MRPKVTLFAEVSAQVGSGHRMRQRAVHECFIARGVSVSVVEYEGRLEPQLAVSRSRLADIAVFDAATDINDALRAVEDTGVMTCTLDWFGGSRPDVAITIYPHGRTDGRLRSYVGAEWIMLRNDILIERRTPAPPQAFDVVICLGSGDIKGQTRGLAANLTQKGLHVAAVFGPYASRSGYVENFVEIVDPPALGRLMRSGALVVANGGTCLLEAVALGVPCLAVPQTPAEASLASWLGVGQLQPDGGNFDTLRGSIRENCRLDEIENSHGFCDGGGGERLVSALVETWQEELGNR